MDGIMIGSLCPVCGGFFFPTRQNQKTCSAACSKRRHDQSEGRKRDRHKPGRKRKPLPAFDRPFTAWDGEGWDGKYTLLANSEGESIANPDGLSTRECLDFLLSAKKARNHIWFSFGYDVNMILHDIPLLGETHSLEELYKTGRTRWRGYRIGYIPRKMFRVSKQGKSFTSYDAFGFFQCSFIKALQKWGIPVPPEIERGKEGRGDFVSWDFEDVKTYNALECKLLVELMNRFRDSLRVANLKPRRWDGAGAVAGVWLESHKVKNYYGKIPDTMRDPVARAYFGGRIELAAWGRAKRIYHYDINSAYPAAMRNCPDMSELVWEHNPGPGLPDQDFSLSHVRWSVPKTPGLWNPFPWRTKHGGILYPDTGEGWYWTVEVRSALQRFPDGIEILESWVPVGELTYPLRDAIEHDYALRSRWKVEGNPAQEPLKLALNSLYGKCAQKKGWGGKPPKYHNLAWAGYITAATRAKISDAIAGAGGRVVCIMTDGIWSLVPIRTLPISKGLGEWSFEEEDVAAEFCGAGLYRSFRKDKSTREYKQRGFGGAEINYTALIQKWEGKRSKAQEIFTLQRFIGMGAAIVGINKYRPHFLRFIPIEKRIKPISVEGTTKRLPDAAGGWTANGLHWQTPRPCPEPGILSYPYVPGLAEEYLDEEERLERVIEREDVT